MTRPTLMPVSVSTIVSQRIDSNCFISQLFLASQSSSVSQHGLAGCWRCCSQSCRTRFACSARFCLSRSRRSASSTLMSFFGLFFLYPSPGSKARLFGTRFPVFRFIPLWLGLWWFSFLFRFMVPPFACFAMCQGDTQRPSKAPHHSVI